MHPMLLLKKKKKKKKSYVTVRLFGNRPQRSIRVAVPSTPHGEREVSPGGGEGYGCTLATKDVTIW